MYYATYQRLNLHVSATDREVIRAVEKKLKPRVRRNRLVRAHRHAIYREMLQHHHDAQELYKYVETGI